MGVFEKLKNALFEEEIVEVEEKPKKPKEKSKLDLFKERKQEKPIAKKVILPEKKEVKVEELDEVDYVDEDFEISPAIKEKLEESYKEEHQKEQFEIDDDDLRVEEDVFPEVAPEPEIVRVLDYDKKEELPEVKEEPKYYQSKPVEKYPYGMTSNKSAYSDYSGGAYEKKDTRTHFTPSPIISPIYGILDKNYRKEDVVQKKEVRLTSSYSRSNLNLDDVRNKAYGSSSIKEDLEREFMDDSKPKVEESFKVEKEESVNLLVDLNEDEKPSVKELTMGDALEYFHDLGLEYNVDYVDASNTVGRRVRDNYDEDVEPVGTRLSKLDEERVEETTEVKEEKKEDVDSDNLFDLIDSMYKDNE